MSAKRIVAEWGAKGRPLQVAGANTRIWSDGEGEAVVCLHGVPASGFLYRKVLPALAEQGLRGITFDLPALGFADRPRQFDYSWTGLSAWTVAALDAAGIERFHLVVHDIGGPVGFDVIRRIPERIQSLTVLNTLVHAASFHRPWVMEPFAYRGVGELWLQGLFTPVLLLLMRLVGVNKGPSNAEIRAYGELLARGDRGKAFLQMMRSFERTEEFEERILAALKARQFPAQVVWGAQDPALKMDDYAPQLCEVLGLEGWHRLPGKHFVQEDSPQAIAALVTQLANSQTSE